MNHAEVRSCLGDYLDGELALDRRALVDAHLDRCESCTSEVAGLRRTVALVRSLPDPEPPPNLTMNVMRRVRAGEAQAPSLARAAAWLADLLWPGLAVPVAAMLAALFVAVGSGQIVLPAMPTMSVWEGLRGGSEAASGPQLVAAAPEAGRLARVPQPLTPGHAAFVATPGLPAPLLSQLDAPGKGKLVSLRRVEPGAGLFSVRSPHGPGSAVPRTPDDWLTVLARSPGRFARVQAGLSLAEQELWARQLARRAVDRGVADDVVAKLRGVSAREAQAFAEAFVEQATAYRQATADLRGQ